MDPHNQTLSGIYDDIRDYWKSDNRGSFALMQWASGVGPAAMIMMTVPILSKFESTIVYSECL